MIKLKIDISKMIKLKTDISKIDNKKVIRYNIKSLISNNIRYINGKIEDIPISLSQYEILITCITYDYYLNNNNNNISCIFIYKLNGDGGKHLIKISEHKIFEPFYKYQSPEWHYGLNMHFNELCDFVIFLTRIEKLKAFF